MAMTDSDPTVRAQELGEALRALREEANISVRTAGARIDASASKISRLENGKNAVTLDDVAALLAIYAVTGPRRRKLLDLAREAEHRGWWQRSAPTFAERQETLMSLESKALAITSVELAIVPGLLQTGEYTRAIMTESSLVSDADVEDRMVTRLQRHSVLLRRNPPGLLAIIDELALLRVVGGRDVLRRQHEHLIEMAQRPNVVVRVLLNSERAHAALSGSFMVIRRPEGTPVVFVENLTSSLFLEERDEIQQYEVVTRELLNHALDPAESMRYLAGQAGRLHPGAAHDDHHPEPGLD